MRRASGALGPHTGITAAGFLMLAILLLAACSSGATIEPVAEQANAAPTPTPLATVPTVPPLQCPEGARVAANGRCWVPVADASPGASSEVYATCATGDPGLVLVGPTCHRVRPEVCGSDWPVPSRRGCTAALLETENPACAEFYLALSRAHRWGGPGDPGDCPEIVPWDCGEVVDSACTEVVATGEWSCGQGSFDVIALKDNSDVESLACGKWIPEDLINAED